MGCKQVLYSEVIMDTYPLIFASLGGLFQQLLYTLDVHLLVYLFEDIISLFEPVEYRDFDQREFDGGHLS